MNREGIRAIWDRAVVFLGLILAASAVPTASVEAFDLGNTYDASNWEEIKEISPPPLLNWVKNGDFVVKTGELDFQWKIIDPKFEEASQDNEGKFEIDEKGYLIAKGTNEPPEFVYGAPFPSIDPKDPKAGAKIMENYSFARYRFGGMYATATTIWVGRGGKEREVIGQGRMLYYQGRERGPMKRNPSNFLEQQMQYVVEPFDVRGFVTMTWMYYDDRLDSVWAYVPVVRRIRRMTPAARSDPFVGSDGCLDDDGIGWFGKNQTMEWRLLGEDTILAAFSRDKRLDVVEEEDGSIRSLCPKVKFGYETEGWEGAAWAPVDLVWHPRQVWIVESIPKDPYYNYGKMLYYVDKDCYNIWFKVINDKAGEYWKSMVMMNNYQWVRAKGTNLVNNTVGVTAVIIDDNNNHATETHPIPGAPPRDLKIYLTENDLGPEYFTEARMLQLSK